MKIRLHLLAVYSIILGSNVFAQTGSLYNEGMAALNKNDISAAKSLFRESAGKYRDAASFNMLGNLQVKEETFEARFLALDNFKEAVLREPGNNKYRLDYARLLIQSNKREGAVEFNKLIKSDAKNIDIYIGIGDDFKKRFEQGYNWGNYQDVYIDGAYDNYSMADKCYLRAVNIDDMNLEANIGLAELSAYAIEFPKAISILEKLNRKNPDILAVNLRLALYNYKLNRTKSAWVYFNKALTLMSEKERKVYNNNSVEMFLPELVQKKLAAMPEEEKNAYINKYWNVKDPLYMTEENERLLAHYFRVAYSNLYFGSPSMGLEGWQSDRGKVFISFGEPMARSSISEDPEDDLNISYGFFYTSPWKYPDGTSILFDSYGMNNYCWLSRFDGPTTRFFSKMENSGDRYVNYRYDKFASYELTGKNVYNIPVQVNVFKSLSSEPENNVYFTYLLPKPNYNNKVEHDYSLFIHNELMDLENKTAGTVRRDFINAIEKAGRPVYEKLNTLEVNIKPGKYNFALETRTLRDSMISSLHKEYEFPSFKKDELDLSGLLIASRVEEGNTILGAIKRNDTYILPKIGRSFKNSESFFLYYEAYNLAKKANGETDFEHTIAIRETEPPEVGIPIKKIFKNLSNLVNGSSDKVSLTTAYKTHEKDSQVYIQLDISKYKPGKYDLSVLVHDKISGEKVEREWQFEITDTKEVK